MWVLIDNRLIDVGGFLELSFPGIHFSELDTIGIFLRLEVEGTLELGQRLIPFLPLQIDFTEPGINMSIVAGNFQSLQKLPFGIRKLLLFQESGSFIQQISDAVGCRPGKLHGHQTDNRQARHNPYCPFSGFWNFRNKAED